MEIAEVGVSRLDEYARISIAFEVRAVLDVELMQDGLGGIRLSERAVPAYVKDYDELDVPSDWPGRFDFTNWGIFLAMEAARAVGGAVVAWNTPGVHMLEGRQDLSVLWDVRVVPERRRDGIGRALFRRAADWSRARGCSQMKIETQNINVGACRFYAAQGARLGDIRRFAYRGDERVAHEVQLNWYFDC